MVSAIDATVPAAAGAGRPLKSPFSYFSCPFMYGFVRTLNRASRIAAHNININPISQPVFLRRRAHVSDRMSEGCNMRKYIRRHGAIPKDTLSARESNSFPKSEVLPLARATRPSRASHMNDANMQIIANT